MTIRTRETLKNYFKDGARPTQDHFADLVDSAVNISDDGFKATDQNGQELSTPVGRDTLLSFFRPTSPDPLWTMGLSREKDQFVVKGPGSDGPPDGPEGASAPPGAPLLTLDARRRIGVGQSDPQAALDVNGMLRSAGRRGYPAPGAPADGRWHDLVAGLGGCQALEVLAAVAHRGKGRVAMVHAIALNAFNPTIGILDFLNRKRGIRCTHAHYSRRIDRLQLRWAGSSGKNANYSLQIRTGCDYGEGIMIKTEITRLWSDAQMLERVP